jgi:hypothetical protein
MKIDIKARLSPFSIALTYQRRLVSALETVSSSSPVASTGHLPCAFAAAAPGCELFDASVVLPGGNPPLSAGRYTLVGTLSNAGTVLCEGAVDLLAAASRFEVILTLSMPLQGFHAIPKQSIRWALFDMHDTAIAHADSEVEIYFLTSRPGIHDPGGVPLEGLQLLHRAHQSAAFAQGRGAAESAPDPVAVVKWAFQFNPPRYDIYGGSSWYTNSDFNNLTLYLNRFLAAKGDPDALVNCYDEAAVVQYYLQGTAPVVARIEYLFMKPFGYLATTNLLGRGECNNPFYAEDEKLKVIDPTDPARTAFGNHAFCRIVADQRILDSCAGPHIGTEDLAQYIALATDGVTPEPPRVKRGTVNDVTVKVGVTSVNSLTVTAEHAMEFTQNLKQFKAAIGHDGSKLKAADTELIFPRHPTLLECPLLQEKGWQLVYHETIPGYPELLNYWRLQSAGGTIELTIHVANDAVTTAQNRFMQIASSHSMSGPVFGPGPTQLGESAAAFKVADRQRIIWVDCNLVFDLLVVGGAPDAEALARWCQERIRACPTASEGAPQAAFPAQRVNPGDVVNANASVPGKRLQPLSHAKARAMRLVAQTDDSVSLIMHEKGDFSIPFVVFDPDTLRASFHPMAVSVS